MGAYWLQFTVLRETDLVRLRVRGQGWGVSAHSQILLKPYVLRHCSWVSLGTHSLPCSQTLGVSFTAVKQIRSCGWGWAAVARKAKFQFLPSTQSPPAFGATGLSTVILPRTVGKNQCPPLVFCIASVPSQNTLRVSIFTVELLSNS